MTLFLVSNNLHVQASTLRPRQLLTPPDPSIDKVSDISLQPPSKVLVQGRATTQHNVLVQASSDIDRTGLDHAIDNLWQRRQEVRAVDFGVEEDFGCQESFVAYVDDEGGTASGLDRGVFGEAAGIGVEAVELLDNVGADVAELLLDALGSLQAGVGLASVTEQGLDEVGDVATGDWDGFDGRADNVTLGDGDDVGHTISGIDNGTGEGAVLGFGGGPGGSKGEDGLDGNVETGAVEGLEHDLGGVLTGFWRVEWWFGEEEVVIFGLDAEVLEYRGLPESLHVVPVFDLTVTDWVVESVA